MADTENFLTNETLFDVIPQSSQVVVFDASLMLSSVIELFVVHELRSGVIWD